ncbi:MAG: glutamate-1-semialdehyde 2,1-aminomutase [Acidimicrobiia bacterium]|nr:glutamate-1-semialdehyde 2,1-aminomutase [Acidimicrobiia bacterium]
MSYTTNAEAFEASKNVLVGGVNSPVRSFGSVGGTPYVVDRGEGAYIYDIEGNGYIDYVQSYGPSILGHANPVVVAAVTAAAERGTSYGAPTIGELELAEVVADRIDGLEMLRMTSSGTEAAMSAIRLARGATGRTKIIKFDGNYHGHVDALLAKAGSGVQNQGLSGSAGVPASVVADTIVLPYNQVPSLTDEIAVVAVEPVAANMGLVPPLPGFLQGLRDECDRVGAMLLFDEVITGFRLAYGGAVEWSGVRPDVWAFGKVIGGGLPVGAFGGSREVMSNVAPLGPVYQGGTLSGNPLAVAAGRATIELLDRAAYAELTSKAEKLAVGIRSAFATTSIPVQVPQVGPLLGFFFADTPVIDNEGATASADTGYFAPLFHALLAEGIALAPGPYEIMFPSLAHTDDVLDRTIESFHTAASSL